MSFDFPPSFPALQQIAATRRSVRAFLPEPIPVDVLDACIDVAIQAPSSQNLEIWRFVNICDPNKRAELNRFCMNQPQALQAPTLLVVVARPDLWREGCGRMLELLSRDADPPPADANYRAWIPRLVRKYRVLIPLLFNDGPLHLLAPLKSLAVSLCALSRPMMRGPLGKAEKDVWAVKTAALACENFMLA